MLLSKTTKVKWNSKIKQHYVDKGYTFTKMGDEFEVDVHDLTIASRSIVKVRCDYCNKEYETTWLWYYKNHYRNSNLHTSENDCCSDPACTGKKAAESLMERHGVSNAAYIDGVSEKKAITCMERYGVDNPAKAEWFKDRSTETFRNNYGVDHPMQLQHMQDRVAKTCMEKYGVECYLQLNYGSDALMKDKNPNWNPSKTEEDRIKERRTHEYREWRKSVFERDGYKCVKCGKKGVKYGSKCRSNGLNAHHIKNYKSHLNLRYEVDNGVTLCNVCHCEFHGKYGNKDNNMEQLTEFLSQDKKIC